MTNRKVNGVEFSNDFVLFELEDGSIIDLSQITSIKPFKTETGSLIRYNIYFNGEEDIMSLSIKEYPNVVFAWMEYKNSQDIGNHLSHIAHQLQALTNATQVYK